MEVAWLMHKNYSNCFGHICIQKFPLNWANNYCAICGKSTATTITTTRGKTGKTKTREEQQIKLSNEINWTIFRAMIFVFRIVHRWLLPKVLWYAYIINNYKYILLLLLSEGGKGAWTHPSMYEMRFFVRKYKCDNFLGLLVLFFRGFSQITFRYASLEYTKRHVGYIHICHAHISLRVTFTSNQKQKKRMRHLALSCIQNLRHLRASASEFL